MALGTPYRTFVYVKLSFIMVNLKYHAIYIHFYPINMTAIVSLFSLTKSIKGRILVIWYMLNVDEGIYFHYKHLITWMDIICIYISIYMHMVTM